MRRAGASDWRLDASAPMVSTFAWSGPSGASKNLPKASSSAACYGQITNRRPFERIVVFALGGSRIHSCASKLCPTIRGLPSAPGLAAMKAFQSCEKPPVQPVVPPEFIAVIRCVGDLTHK